MLLVSGGDGPEVFEFTEEALDAVSVAVQEGAEGRDVLATGHGFDVCPSAAFGECRAQGVTVIGAIGEQDLAVAHFIQHISRTPAVMGLTLAELESDRQAVGIDESVDLGGQPASRAPHAAGVRSVPKGGSRGGVGVLRTPFLTLAACW